MRVLFDTNVVLDVLLDRQPWVDDSKALWVANDNATLEGWITASSMTDLFYIIRKHSGAEKAVSSVSVCLDAFEICTVDKANLSAAAAMETKDFEDNLQIACAEHNQINVILTRDKAGFVKSSITVLTPTELLARLTSQEKQQ